MSTDYLLFAIPFACVLVAVVFRMAIRRHDGRPPGKR